MLNKIFLRNALYKSPFFFLNIISSDKQESCLLISDSSVSGISLFIKYSIFSLNCFLLELTCFETPLMRGNFLKFSNTLVYIYQLKLIRLIIFINIRDNTIYSIENFFRNARWLEREVSDFFSIFFINKSDRRSIYTIPILQQNAFSKKFPISGFFELFVCFISKRIKFKRVSYLN